MSRGTWCRSSLKIRLPLTTTRAGIQPVAENPKGPVTLGERVKTNCEPIGIF